MNTHGLNNSTIRVINIRIGTLRGDNSFTGCVGFDDIDEISSLIIFLDGDETPLGYAIKHRDKNWSINNCDCGNVDDSFIRFNLPDDLKSKWNLVLLASIDIDEAEDEGVEHYVYFPDGGADMTSSFNVGHDFSNFSQLLKYLAVHQITGSFEWDSDIDLNMPLDKFLRGEIDEGIQLSVDSIGLIYDYETDSEQLCLIRF